MNNKLLKLALVIIVSAIFTLTACKNSNQVIYIQTSKVDGMDDNQKRKDTITIIESEYFEVKLSSVNDGSYIAGKQILKPQIGKEFKTEFFKVVDEKGKEMEFKTPTDFLNFMDKGGYEVKDQTAQKFGIDYTFKKKS